MSKSLYTTIIEETAPTNSTVGIVGQKYLDTTTKKYYICTNIDNGVYTWEELAKSNDLDSKLNTSGGTVSGNLAVQGNLTVTGETTTEKQKTLDVEDNFIYTNANKVELTALLSGIAIYKNGTDIYAIAYDPATDSVKLGLGTRDAQGVFHFNAGEGSPVAVRVDSADLIDNHIIVWDATNHKFIDSGKTINDLLTLINSKVNTSTTINNKSLTDNIKLYGTDIELASDNTSNLTTTIIEANNKINSLQTNKLDKTGGTVSSTLTSSSTTKAILAGTACGDVIVQTSKPEIIIGNYGANLRLCGNISNVIYDTSTTRSSLALLSDCYIVGEVRAFAGTTKPSGWLICDGSAISRTSYAALFSVIGTTYGEGDGTTTFNLPNLIDKFIQGSNTAGTEKTAGLPDITGTLKEAVLRRGSFSKSGVFNDTTKTGDYWDSNKGDSFQGDRYQIDFKASNSNSIYGSSATVQPPALTMMYIIKY